MTIRQNIAIVIIIFNSLAFGQEINVTTVSGARNAAMGDALISESNDISTMFLNPASLSFIKETSLFLNHGQLRDKLGMTENFAIPILQITALTLSLGVETYHLGYLGENKAFPEQRIFEYGYNLSAATCAIAQTFSVGGTLGFRHGQTNSSKAWGMFYSVGINYSPSADINYGFALSNVGDDIRYLPEDSVLTASRVSSEKRLVMGASMKYPSSSSLRRTVFVLALANEKIFGRDGLLYKAGFEVRPWQFLNFRLGYVFGPDISEPRVGAGVSFSVFVLEYVFYGGPSPQMLQQFSLSIKM